MPPADTVVRAAIDEARRLVHHAPFNQVPTDLEAIAAFLGVESIAPASLTIDGYLGVSPSGKPVIRYKDTNPACRNRFTIAHELGHLLLAKCEGSKLTKQTNRDPKYGVQEEYAANRIGAELLMPDAIVRQQMAENSPSENLLRSLSRRLRVSDNALAWRFLEIENHTAVFVRISRDRYVRPAGLTMKWASSRHAPILPMEASENVASRIAREAVSSRKHLLRVQTERALEYISCAGMLRSVRTDYGPRPGYWMIGWMLL